VRVAIGPLSLGDLQPGEWRYLTPAEVNALQELVKEPGPKPGSSARAGGKSGEFRGSARESRYRSGGRRSSGP
jgi:hypothetical protein